jgi:sugar O-acyltransferase (sialic acid O-acetyltransferase NeuD family)
MENPVIIFGAKGLGKVALDIFKSNRIDVYCFLDDDVSLHGKEIGEVSVLGKTDDEVFLRLLGKKCEAFIASDDNKYRQALITMLLEEKKVMPVNAVHEKASLSEYALIGHGNMLHAGVVVSSGANIANHCVIGANATLDFDVVVEDFVQIGAGSVINSGVVIEKSCFIGSGVVIVSGVKIGKGARIGAGSVVVSDVKAKETVFGNPAQVVSK